MYRQLCIVALHPEDMVPLPRAREGTPSKTEDSRIHRKRKIRIHRNYPAVGTRLSSEPPIPHQLHRPRALLGSSLKVCYSWTGPKLVCFARRARRRRRREPRVRYRIWIVPRPASAPTPSRGQTHSLSRRRRARSFRFTKRTWSSGSGWV